jgi:hypothetical protein
MRLRALVRKLKLSLAGLVGGFAFACSGPNPGEMPPMAPRPEPVQPTPSSPDRKAPVPGAPDPLDPTKTGPTIPTPDAGITELAPKFQSSVESTPMQRAPKHTPADAGVNDAVTLPDEVPDALPPDAARRPESTSFHCC